MNSKNNTAGSGNVIALLMAAGKSSRFGSDKRHALMPDGSTVLQTSVTLARKNFDEVWVVLGAADDPEALKMPSGVHIIQAPHEEVGLGTSLGAAFQTLMAQRFIASAAAVLLADMPWVSDRTCQRIIQASGADVIVRPRFESRAGHPVVFGRSFWTQLARLKGEKGARDVIHSYTNACRFIDLDDSGIHWDVDVPDDLNPGAI